jgi:hypothetical protein
MVDGLAGKDAGPQYVRISSESTRQEDIETFLIAFKRFERG